jgi:farnesyl diphosphate synthase/geranylgeranyl diphosphate synthase type II
MINALPHYKARINEQLDRYLKRDDIPAVLLEAMHYALFNGGKRIRPTLVYLATEALGCPEKLAHSTACAVEFIHAYSLIHDDLPAMDDDDLRRGQPTCHIKFGEATAILAGDALQAMAFEVIATDDALSPGIRIALVRELAIAAGAAGMVAGQHIDLSSEDVLIDEKTLENMHQRKTGDLISASVASAAIIANADAGVKNALKDFGYSLGLAFQVRDDILDEVGDTKVIGKPAGSDKHKRKSTFVSIHGMNSAAAQLDDLRARAIDALAPLGEAGDKLRAMADFVANRDH